MHAVRRQLPEDFAAIASEYGHGHVVFSVAFDAADYRELDALLVHVLTLRS